MGEGDIYVFLTSSPEEHHNKIRRPIHMLTNIVIVQGYHIDDISSEHRSFAKRRPKLNHPA
jgi:hypothetical protein